MTPNNPLSFVLVGFLYVGLALPLISKSVKPNRWYGFRVKKTLSDAQIWYKANQIAGFDILLAGLCIIGTAILSYVIQAGSPGFPGTMITFIVFVAAMSAAVAHSFWALRSINK